MARSLLSKITSLSFCSRTPAVILSSHFSLSSSSSSPLSFSSQSHSSTHPNQQSSPQDDLPEDVSTEELKQRIDKYVQGDAEAIPSIFRAILARKISGKHADSDDELMKELQSKTGHQAEAELFDLDLSDESDNDESDEDFSYSEEESD